ncbi:MAG TPA: amidohydrolase family protein [Streptosporangiales bacterium]
MSAGPALEEVVDGLALVDHHVHGALRDDVDAAGFELLLTESDRVGGDGASPWDSQLGFAVRRWCAPVLGLEPHAGPAAYLARRAELGADAVNRSLLAASGVGRYLVDTGFRGGLLHGVEGMRELSGREVHEIVRLEAVAEALAASGVGAVEFPERYREALDAATTEAAGLKSVVAYRYGLDFDPAPPARRDVVAAAGAWLRRTDAGAEPRVTYPVLLRALIWAGVERGLPLQFHVGFGDPDLDLHRCDPLHLTDFLRRTADRDVPILLLHNYPFHRNAGYLAAMFPHVWFDVGLATMFTGARSATVVAESLELAPFGKILYSSDAWGLAELHHLGALFWRRGMATALRRFVDDGEWTEADAVRVAQAIGVDNAMRVYRLTGSATAGPSAAGRPAGTAR